MKTSKGVDDPHIKRRTAGSSAQPSPANATSLNHPPQQSTGYASSSPQAQSSPSNKGPHKTIRHSSKTATVKTSKSSNQPKQLANQQISKLMSNSWPASPNQKQAHGANVTARKNPPQPRREPLAHQQQRATPLNDSDLGTDLDANIDSNLGSNLGSVFDFPSDHSANDTESLTDLTPRDSDLNVPRVIGTQSALATGEVEILFRASSEKRVQAVDERAQKVAPYRRQSPIALSSRASSYGRCTEPLKLKYPRSLENLKLTNTGKFWQIKLPYPIFMQTSLSVLLGQQTHFNLDSFHCHWGKRDESGGSEHTIDNKYYSGELHFVHYNIDKYQTVGRAACAPDGMAVIAVFLDANRDYRIHTELEKIVSYLKAVKIKASSVDIKQSIVIENLLPRNRSYWMYSGSMTTEPFYESVTWFVMKCPIKCHVSQISKFRQLETGLSPGGAPILTNRRSLQWFFDRSIYTYDEPSTSNWWGF
ncbi:Carbonic anhydrase 2, partial [Fragariocoptes setiger]